MPRDPEGQYQPAIIPRSQRRQENVNGMVHEMFLQGVSTREVEAVLKPLLDTPLSAHSVSRVARSGDLEVKRYQKRPLSDHCQHQPVRNLYALIMVLAAMSMTV